VSTADFNGDGWMDIYVANDGQPNQLWINQRNGTFTETAQLAGAAVSGAGNAEAGMGVDAGDFDNDGDEDLFITELTGQGADLYVNVGGGVFEEHGARAGLRRPTLPFTGFGAAWLDIDNDGWLDLVTVNGAVTQNVDAAARGERFALQQRKQAFRNLGNGRFEDVSTRAGPAFARADVSRGAAFGDIDNDGDIDIVVSSVGQKAVVLGNDGGNHKNWLGIRTIGKTSNRDGIGCRVKVVSASGATQYFTVSTAVGYLSASDKRLLVGLDRDATARLVEIRWPSGVVQRFEQVKAGQILDAIEPAS